MMNIIIIFFFLHILDDYCGSESYSAYCQVQLIYLLTSTQYHFYGNLI